MAVVRRPCGANQYAASRRLIWRERVRGDRAVPFVLPSTVVSCMTMTLSSFVTPMSSSSMSAPARTRLAERVERVGGELVLAALVGDVERRVLLDPAVLRGLGRRHRQQQRHQPEQRGEERSAHALQSSEPLPPRAGTLIRRVQGLLLLREGTRLRQQPEPLHGRHQAPLQPEPPEGPDLSERDAPTRVRVHALPQGLEGHEGPLARSRPVTPPPGGVQS